MRKHVDIATFDARDVHALGETLGYTDTTLPQVGGPSESAPLSLYRVWIEGPFGAFGDSAVALPSDPFGKLLRGVMLIERCIPDTDEGNALARLFVRDNGCVTSHARARHLITLVWCGLVTPETDPVPLHKWLRHAPLTKYTVTTVVRSYLWSVWEETLCGIYPEDQATVMAHEAAAAALDAGWARCLAEARALVPEDHRDLMDQIIRASTHHA